VATNAPPMFQVVDEERALPPMITKTLIDAQEGQQEHSLFRAWSTITRPTSRKLVHL